MSTDAGGHVLRLERQIDAPLDDVYAALTRADLIAQWFWTERLYGLPMRAPTSAWAAPGQSRSNSREDNPGPCPVFYHTVERTCLEFTWQWQMEEGEGESTIVRFDLLERDEQRTLLTLTQQAFSLAEDRDQHGEGWSDSLEKLEKKWRRHHADCN